VAPALGNFPMQLPAPGAVASLRPARDVIARSFPVERFEPRDVDGWDAHYERFHEYVELTCV
jgi:rhamnulokinase